MRDLKNDRDNGHVLKEQKRHNDIVLLFFKRFVIEALEDTLAKPE